MRCQLLTLHRAPKEGMAEPRALYLTRLCGNLLGHEWSTTMCSHLTTPVALIEHKARNILC
ncbi:hypothetical protein E2C01_063119 [Portunus trituberculatus]|uniref:Uncharacterized protein n=1 Tax=Portunus trituberculatus TaxID=210409 RepID=A0A5B7HJE9_PORTR|nr:hypothetical protein [Portunus trituberculatus]